MNSFLACGLSTALSDIMSIHIHFDYVCVCASMYGLGFADGLVLTMFCDFDIWMGDGYLCIAVGVRSLLVWRKAVRRGYYLGLRAFDVYYCSHVGALSARVWRADVCCYIVQLGSTILCMSEFCSSLYAGYSTIHKLLSIICLLLLVCSIVLCPVVSNIL